MSQKLGTLCRPQWFIRFHGNALEVNKDVLCSLRALGCHLAVIAVAGSLRTGKSWILNRLADCDVENDSYMLTQQYMSRITEKFAFGVFATNIDPAEPTFAFSRDAARIIFLLGFGVADGQTAVTAGIWILCREHPLKKNCVLVFLDTEGLHDPYKKDTTNEDNKLFTLAFLLADTFIFNAMHKFDNNDLEKIAFISMIAKKLQKIDAMKAFPEFILLLRDVAKVKVHGKQVEPKQYLEDVLKSSEDDDIKFSPKWCIREYCQRRQCFTLTQPVEFEDLEDLGQETSPELRPRYVQDEKNLKEHLLRNVDVKRFANGSPCTTNAFCEFTEALKTNVQDGCIPKIHSLQQRIADDENKRIWDVVTKAFAAAMRDEGKDDLYESLNEKFIALQREGIEVLDHNLIPLGQEHKEGLIQNFKDLSNDEYHIVSAEKCREYLQCLLEQYFIMVEENCYKAPNAKGKFEEDVQKAKEMYFRKARRFGPEKSNVWEEKVREIKRKMKDLELVDLHYQLDKTDIANKEERRQLEQRIIDMENDRKEQQKKMEDSIREQNRIFKQKEEELEMKRQRYEADLVRQRDQMASQIETMKQNFREEITKEKQALNERAREIIEEGNRQAQRANEANVTSAFISGISLVGAATIEALGRLEASVNSMDPDETARRRRLIWINADRKNSEGTFSHDAAHF